MTETVTNSITESLTIGQWIYVIVLSTVTVLVLYNYFKGISFPIDDEEEKNDDRD